MSHGFPEVIIQSTQQKEILHGLQKKLCMSHPLRHCGFYSPNMEEMHNNNQTIVDLHLSISNDIVSTKIYEKRNDFDYKIVNFPF